MCGIFGYAGYREAAPILIEGLKKLEYRGYDSFGIATLGTRIEVHKKRGKISEDQTEWPRMPGTIGISHTRWATHGVPNDLNAHPHLDCTGRIAVVHNGVIENYFELKKDLEQHGHIFSSDTDTEVIAHLIESHYRGTLQDAVVEAIRRLEGSYALLVLAENDPRIIAARNKSPLVLGIGDKEMFAASDVTPLLDYTERIIVLEDGDLATISPEGIKVRSGGTDVERPVERVTWHADETRKGGFEHFMLKEIYEQPGVFFETYRAAKDEEIVKMIRDSSRVTAIACGSSYHASLLMKYLIEEYGKQAVRVEFASEFKYYTPPVSGVVIAISQSGETADTLAALRKAKLFNCPTVAITNVQGSSLARIADKTLFMRAGPEMSVAATKSFIAQVAVFLQLTNMLSDGGLNLPLLHAHRAIEEALLIDLFEAVAICRNAEHIFYIGRGPFYPVSMEGSLKMKEISYIHAEAYPAGELKHGPFALLTEKTPVVAICPGGLTRAVMISNIKEVKARGAPVIALGESEDTELQDVVDVFIPLPATAPVLQILTSTIVLQLLAYFTAKEIGCEIDKPRNLAKSVTVE
ncbi:MAG: glutamine--fructose-6-phosphate transaminase (isomerizing) [Methanomicrobiales archaeon]|nr:glutamine--fructose-6-phosphate transaminase (isomerizing) [Methanomicrobiales archaeon]